MGLDISALACGEGNNESCTSCSGVQADSPLHQPTQLRHLHQYQDKALLAPKPNCNRLSCEEGPN